MTTCHQLLDRRHPGPARPPRSTTSCSTCEGSRVVRDILSSRGASSAEIDGAQPRARVDANAPRRPDPRNRVAGRPGPLRRSSTARSGEPAAGRPAFARILPACAPSSRAVRSQGTTARCSRSPTRSPRPDTRSRSQRPTHSPARPRAPASRPSGRGSGPSRGTSSARASPTPTALSPDRIRSFFFSELFVGIELEPRARDLQEIVDRWSPDLIVHDLAELAGPLVASERGLPYASHGYGPVLPGTVVAPRPRPLRRSGRRTGSSRTRRPGSTGISTSTRVPRGCSPQTRRRSDVRRWGSRRPTRRQATRPGRRFSKASAAGRSSTSRSARSGTEPPRCS